MCSDFCTHRPTLSEYDTVTLWKTVVASTSRVILTAAFFIIYSETEIEKCSSAVMAGHVYRQWTKCK